MSDANPIPETTQMSEILERLARIELLIVSDRTEGVEENEPPADAGGAALLADDATDGVLTLAQEFERFVDGLGFPNFRGREFTPYWSRVRGGVRNSPPPQELWDNIVPTLAVLQRFRTETGQAVQLLSTFRSPAYNQAVGGATGSMHKVFKAIDFSVASGTPAQWAARLRSYRGKRFRNPRTGQQFEFHGGIGVYPASRFVHIDTRGNDVDW